MKHSRTIVLILSVFLIVLGALLPNIVGSRQDAANDGEFFFATINDIQLEFEDGDMTLRETIAILCGIQDSVEIPGDLASLKRDYVEGIANVTAEAYRDAGIAFFSEDGTAYGFEITMCQSMLGYSSVDAQSSIFWFVNLVGHDKSQNMYLIIDDRTGTVCSVEYSDGDLEQTEEDMVRVLYNFSDIYLQELGEEFYDFDINKILKDAQSPQDKSYLASSIRWWAGDYEYRTTFLVNSNGFYTYLAVETY